MNRNTRLKGLITHLYFLRSEMLLKKKLHAKLVESCSNESHAYHGETSKDQYDVYGERELVEYETGSGRVLKDGRLATMPYKAVRDVYVQPVKDAVSAMLESQEGEGSGPLKILEVGCGNATNLKLLKEAFGDRVALYGIDISANRIAVGQKYWGERIAGIDLRQADATALSMFDDSSFDLVYSVCALEQITYRLHEAVGEMVRVGKGKLVLVEPVFEFGNKVQRLYNIVGDQCRTLIPELKSFDLDVAEKGLMPVLHYPLNPVGLLVAEKRTGKKSV